MQEVTSSASRIITVTMTEGVARALVVLLGTASASPGLKNVEQSLRTTLGLPDGPGMPRGPIGPAQRRDARRGFEPGYAPRNENPSVDPSIGPDGIAREGQFE